MKRQVAFLLFLATLTGCALKPTWHWEKPGASDQEYSFDLNQCKAATYSDASGFVTNESVRRMFSCMERKGWSRKEN
ncbi:MAG: hypothetical protein WA787_13670 [Azonexus sp.]